MKKLTGQELKYGTSLPPMSISYQVCSLDIDYVQVQGSTLGKIKYHRVNITLNYECNSWGIDYYSKYSKVDNCFSLEHRSMEVVPIIEVRVWDKVFWMKEKKTRKYLVLLEKPMQISYLLYLTLLLRIMGENDFMKFSHF